MVAPQAIIWVASLLSTGLLLGNLLAPKLPVYHLDILYPGLLPRWRNGHFTTRLRNRISLHNANHMHLDLYHLTFDMYYMGWDGTLEPIGQIQDKHQIELNSTLTPIWRIGARADFSTLDDMYITTYTWPLVKKLTLLIYHWFVGFGTLWVPVTGVAHITAAHQFKATVALVCDNYVNTWRLQVHGLQCILDDVHVGWLPLETYVPRVRAKALETLRANASGIVIHA